MKHHTTSLLILLSVSLLLGFSTLLYLDHRLAKAFAALHPDQTLGELLVQAGQPSAKSDCETAERPIRRENTEALAKLQGSQPRYCKMILRYRSFLPGDGWTIAIDEQDVIMQIDRNALP
jgi:hypothetical protein